MIPFSWYHYPMETTVLKNKEEALISAGKALTDFLKTNINNETLLLSSGGSSLAILNYVSPIVLSKKTTVTVLDTRIGVNRQDENFKQLSDTEFYKEAKNKGVQFIDVSHLSDLSPKEAGEEFDLILRNWMLSRIGAKIVATVGMGADGHIAGIMPIPDNKKLFNSLFADKEKLAVGYSASGKIKFPKRLTATKTFLSRADKIVTFISGEEKRDKLSALLSKKDFKEEEFPAVMLRQFSDVSIFTDIR